MTKFVKKVNYVWEQRKLGEVLIERNVQHPQNAEFPLVSFTVENGVTPKTDRYEREQLIRGDKKGKKYKETRRDDIVYNPANLKFGAIARNKYGNAVFSPIYVTYEVDKSTIFPSFVEMFVTRDSFIQNALQYQQGTVYERMSVNTSDFEKLDIAIPSLAEQKEIGEYFSTLDHLITLHQRKICIFIKKMPIDWEQRKVLDLLIQPITDGPHETPKLVEEGVPFISVDAIVDNKIDFSRKRGNISEEYDELCCKKYKPQFHDVYLVKSGSTVGKVAIVETTDRFNIWSPLAAMRCGEKTYPYFLYDLLQTKDLQAQVADKASNGTQPNLSMRELEKFPVSVPSNLEEQKKIGDYFRNLDHLITLHHRKCVVLRKKKVNDWEQRKLGKVLKERTERAEGNEELLSVTISNGVIRQVDSDKRNIASEDKSNYKIVCKGDIAYNSMRMWQGAVGNSEYDGIVSPAYTVLVPTEEANSKFFMELFKKESSLQIFQRWSQGLTSDTWNLKYPVLSSIQFCMPSVEEQVKIGEYFSNLDHLITLHHRECVILQKTKVNDWEQRKLGELVIIERGGSPRPIDKFITKDENGLNWIKIGDAPEQGNYITQTAEKIKPEGLSKTREVHPGDLILSNSMSFGKPYIMAIDGCIHDGWLVIRDTKKRFDLTFLCTLLGTDSMLNQYKAMAAGSAVNNLNKELVGGTTVLYPDIKEQELIGEYFSHLDHLITLHQHKCDEMKKLKKYMLQKLFPQNGKKVPEIRFDGFTNDWEQRKLGELVGIYDGVHQTPDYQDSGIMFLSVENIATLKSEKYISEEAFERDYKVYPEKGDILMTRIGDVGTTNVVEIAEKVAFYVSLALLKPNGIDSYFLSNAMKTNPFLKGLRERTLVTAIPQKINKDEIGKIDIFITNNDEEQKKIGAYFHHLDHLITLHQHKCDELQNLKKYMLQNMFV